MAQLKKTRNNEQKENTQLDITTINKYKAAEGHRRRHSVIIKSI